MDTERWQILLKAIDRGSLRAAAEEMGFTVSGISRSVATLEKELGFALLHRAKSGVQPTAECRQLLPSVRELSTQLTINPNTIQRAYHELESEGYIVSVPGKGSFCAQFSPQSDPRREELLARLEETVRELRWLGVSEEEIIDKIGGDGHGEH